MTFVYTLKDVIGLITVGVSVVLFLLIVLLVRMLGKVSEWRKRREERIEKKLQEMYDKENSEKEGKSE